MKGKKEIEREREREKDVHCISHRMKQQTMTTNHKNVP